MTRAETPVVVKGVPFENGVGRRGRVHDGGEQSRGAHGGGRNQLGGARHCCGLRDVVVVLVGD